MTKYTLSQILTLVKNKELEIVNVTGNYIYVIWADKSQQLINITL